MSNSREDASPMEAYQSYMVPVEFEPWSAELLDRIRLRTGERVLDLACGTGVVARAAATRVGTSGAVVGVDVNPVMLDAARSLPSSGGVAVEWTLARAEDVPFADGSFDVVLSQQGVQFFADRDNAAREMKRVLKAGGRVGVSVWRGHRHQSVKGAVLRALQDMFGPGAAVAYSFGESSELRDLLNDAGFHDVHIETVRRQMHEPSAGRMVRMLVLGASAAVPALASLDADARERAIAEVRERVDADIEAVRVPDGISYVMESNIAIAFA